MQQITTFLMFEGRAGEAIQFYMSLFDDSEILSIEYYTSAGPGKEGSVIHAVFTLNGQQFMAIDSAIQHNFTFTPATSLYVNCKSEDEINKLSEQLSDSGQVLMPLDKYPFADKFAWLNDKFGVSWQLSFKS